MLDEVMTFAEACKALNKSASYINNMVATGKLKEGYHYRQAGRTKLIKRTVVEELKKDTFISQGLIGATWGELTRDLQDALLANASAVDGRDCSEVKNGECIVDLTDIYSVNGYVVDCKIQIDSGAIIYSPLG